MTNERMSKLVLNIKLIGKKGKVEKKIVLTVKIRVWQKKTRDRRLLKRIDH